MFSQLMLQDCSVRWNSESSESQPNTSVLLGLILKSAETQHAIDLSSEGLHQIGIPPV
jgi:hypothetical protein